MSKKNILVLMGFVFLFSFNFAYAEVVINEIMYDLDGADIDWMEIYNPDSADANLSTLKLLISNSESNHGIIKYSGSEILHQGDYGVIVVSSQVTGFVSRWSEAENIFTSSFSLPNESATVQINSGDKNSPLDSLTYASSDGASGDGKSLDRSLTPVSPTPGQQNVEGSENEEDVEEISSGSSSSESSGFGGKKAGAEKIEIIPPKNKTEIEILDPAFAGLPIQFKVSNTVSNKSCGKYFLNFGDGNFLETEKTSSIPQEFSHIYYYPGEYIVNLECYKSYLSSEPDSSNKITIKVLSSEVVISRVGEAQDFFVEISNNSFSEADISGWILSSFQNKFVFPKNSILKPKNKIIVSPRTTNFSVLDRDTLKLINSEGEIMSEYLSLLKSIKPIKNSVQASNVKSETEAVKPPLGGFTAKSVVLDDLEATAFKSEVDTGSNFMYEIGLFVFLGMSAGGAYFIRNRNRKIAPKEAGSDFEIMDE